MTGKWQHFYKQLLPLGSGCLIPTISFHFPHDGANVCSHQIVLVLPPFSFVKGFAWLSKPLAYYSSYL